MCGGLKSGGNGLVSIMGREYSVVMRFHERANHATGRAVPCGAGSSGNYGAGTGGPIRTESRTTAPRLYAPRHRHGQADLTFGVQRQGVAAHPLFFVVSGLTQACV